MLRFEGIVMGLVMLLKIQSFSNEMELSVISMESSNIAVAKSSIFPQRNFIPTHIVTMIVTQFTNHSHLPVRLPQRRIVLHLIPFAF